MIQHATTTDEVHIAVSLYIMYCQRVLCLAFACHCLIYAVLAMELLQKYKLSLLSQIPVNILIGDLARDTVCLINSLK